VKKFLSVFLLSTLILGVFAGCQTPGISSTDSSSEGSSESSPETTLGSGTIGAEGGGGSPIDVDDEFHAVTDGKITMETEDMRLVLKVGNGIVIESLFDKILNYEYLPSAGSLFKYTVYTNLNAQNHTAWRSEGERFSKSDVEVEVAELNRAGNHAKLVARSEGGDFTYRIDILFTDSMSFDVRMDVTAHREDPVFLKMYLPTIPMLNMKQEDATVMIPQEAGWVAPYDGKSHMGFEKMDGTTGLPNSVNAMELVTVHSETLGGGIFFSDTEGSVDGANSQIQFILDGYTISGLWGVGLQKEETRSTPAMSVGLFRNRDWRFGVDYYMSRRDKALLPHNIPAWWLESGGIYSTHPGAGGPFTFWYGTGRLPTFINRFEELDQVLEEAREYGLDTILLQDWYECPDRNDPSIPESWWNDKSLDPYSWNKGDYQPREDMGGVEAFKAGIQKVHDAGGRVVVYVEPFIVLYYSNLAKNEAKDWYALDAYGNRWEAYGYNYSMVPNNVEWQNKLAEICETLVRDYGVDGIYLDSLGWQFGHANSVASDPTTVYTPDDYNAAWVTLLKKVRDTVKAGNPDAVVLCESGCGPMLYAADGGWTSDFAWGKTTTKEEMTESPLRYAMSYLGVFTNGETIRHLNQVFAAGYSLTISDPWKAYDSYIKTLVGIRQTYADALIYGKQVCQPETNHDDAIAYLFRGDTNTVITCANLGERRIQVTLSLGKTFADMTFINAVDNVTYQSDAEGNVTVSLRTEKIVALVQQNATT